MDSLKKRIIVYTEETHKITNLAAIHENDIKMYSLRKDR
jgi:hypothetical protein